MCQWQSLWLQEGMATAAEEEKCLLVQDGVSIEL